MQQDVRDLMDDFDVSEIGYSQHPDAIRQRRWRAANLDRARLREQVRTNNYRARQYGVRGVLTLVEWVMRCAEFGNRCAECGEPETTIDHIVPMERGGVNSIENIQPLCRACNRRKGRR